LPAAIAGAGREVFLPISNRKQLRHHPLAMPGPRFEPLPNAVQSVALAVSEPLLHGLSRHYAELRQLRNRRQLQQCRLYREIQPELARLLVGLERGVHPQPAPPAVVRPGSPPARRFVAWNIQRGTQFGAVLAALRDQPELATADAILLSEVDYGMGRSGNRHVAAELAKAIGAHYVFGVSYLVLGDDFLENPDRLPNTQALAGAALLSRWPIGRAENVELPELRDKFSSRREKRLGQKRALLVELLLPEGPLVCAACHLDSNASPAQRAVQLAPLLQRAMALAGENGPVLVGGDFNTTTYDASGPLPLFRDLLHKLFVTGFEATIDGYMVPEQGYERPLFELLARQQFVVDGFNDRAASTYVYDVMSPYGVSKLHSKVGRLLTRWLQYRLRRWNGVIPARLDWFAGRGVTPLHSAVVALDAVDGRPASDHLPILVDVVVRPSAG
jgi:endonuclease/exonuclease/phosphatase family metal-dependent hydrolase